MGSPPRTAADTEPSQSEPRKADALQRAKLKKHGLWGPEDSESQTTDAELMVLLEFDFA